MKVFKLYFKIIKSNLPALLMYLGIFLGIFATVMTSFDSTNQGIQYQEVDLAIVDYDQTKLSQALVDSLSRQNSVKPLEDLDQSTINQKLFSQELDYVLFIEEGLSADFLSGRTVAPVMYPGVNPGANAIIDQQINTLLYLVDAYRQAYGGEIPEDRMDWVLNEVQVLLSEEVEGALYQSPEQNRFNIITLHYFLIQMIYPLIALGFIIVGYTITKLERNDVKRRDIVSGYSEIKRSRDIFLSSFLAMTIIWVLLFIIGLFFTKIDLLSSTRAQLMILSSYIHTMALTCIIILLANCLRSQKAMSVLGTIVSLVIAFSVGIFVPREIVWKPLNDFSRISPAYWDVSNQILLGLSPNGIEISYQEVLQNISVMFLMGILAFVLTLILRKSREKI